MWGWLLLVPAVLFLAEVVTAPFSGFHQHLSFAGTPGRFAGTVVRAGRSNARAALWFDNVFVVSWLLIVPRLLQAGRDRWAPERRTMFGPWPVMPSVAVAAGVADLFENALALSIVGKSSPPLFATLSLAVVGWVKVLLYAVALVGVLGLVVGPLLAPVVRPALRRLFGRLDRHAGTHPDPVAAPATTGSGADEPTGNDGEAIGICLSGGGIRAASIALGALRRLDEPTSEARSLFRRSRWLVAVSGGSYTAGGWRISRRPGAAVAPVASVASDGLFAADQPWAATVRMKRRFLDNGTLSIVGGVLNAAVRTTLVLGAVVSATYLVAALLGRGVRTRVVHPGFPFQEGTVDPLTLLDLVPVRLVLPIAVFLVAAVVLFVVAHARSQPERRAALVRWSRVVGAAGALLALLLVGVPAGVLYGRRLLNALAADGGPDRSAGLIGTAVVIGVAAAVGGVVAGQVKRRWMRLGGVLLGVALFLFAGKVADSFAYGYVTPWTSWPLPGTEARLGLVAVAVAWLLLIAAVASHRLTLGGVYRKRLAATFAAGDHDEHGPAGERTPLPPLAYSDEPLWPAYRGADGPELIVAATAHASSATFCGLPAYGFTFRPDRITLHDRTDGTSASVDTDDYPVGSWWDGFPRGWLVSRAMALSGAAFASAMGRQALGSTDMLLVALNLRLGAWVPNPRYAHWFADPATSPRVHLGYLAKELTGRYRPDRDAFVYVADGGHRENLGLVELLRERPAVVFCVDASGDPPGTFQSLDDAIALAAVELGVVVDIDLTAMRTPAGAPSAAPGVMSNALPDDCVAEGVVTYPASMGGGTARLLYGHHQVCEATPPALLQFAAAHPPFPSYPTVDQFLTDDEHLQLVALGEHVAGRMVERFERGTA
jgi:hypothetical protein